MVVVYGCDTFGFDAYKHLDFFHLISHGLISPSYFGVGLGFFWTAGCSVAIFALCAIILFLVSQLICNLGNAFCSSPVKSNLEGEK